MEIQAFPFTELPVDKVLILISFMVLLTIGRGIFSLALKAPLLGEIVVGLIFGTPLLDLLGISYQTTFSALGYLGLISMVFEGGLGTDLALAKANLGLSMLVGNTGIILPIAICMVLLPFGFGYSMLQSFTVGAALSATSLGTSFASLEDAGMMQSRIGTVLITAAMYDDVTGLVISQVIHGLGSHEEHPVSLGWTIGRPILAAAGLLLVTWAIVKYVALPVIPNLASRVNLSKQGSNYAGMLILFSVVTSFIAVSSYSGTSNLLGSYLAGVALSTVEGAVAKATDSDLKYSPSRIFERHVVPLQKFILAPLFFATIGFAIPIRNMFDGKTVWMGLVLSILMIIAKFLSAIWIPVWHYMEKSKSPAEDLSLRTSLDPFGAEPEADRKGGKEASGSLTILPVAVEPVPAANKKTSVVPPVLVLGMAMVSRGEVGLLIANIGYPSVLDDRLFMISIWAILICTVVGPFCVGQIVRRTPDLGKWA
ncbi:Sodium/hydrogen exchanger family-domain-containing protein [Gaertneriomyces semiglobifer]|nr:Sodium/hydrogen exchanger family-domain-containing protein [Gaertneriomyces semiglobifer]